MILTVPCSEIKCIYNTEGSCNLHSAKPIDLKNIRQDKCLYYSEKILLQKIKGKSAKQGDSGF